ncbi:MAG: amino acid adenylation domain-containing protein [Bacillota bacterium]
MNANILTLYREFEDARKYWEDKLGGEISELKFPVDYAKTNRYIKGNYEMVLDEELSGKLTALSKNQDLLLYIIMMTGMKVLLYKYTGQEDVIVGAPVYKDDDIQKLNRYVALRDFLHDEMSFKELLMSVKQTVSEGFKNQHYPVEKLVEQIEDKNGNLPIFKASMMMDGIHNRGSYEDIASSSMNYFSFIITKEGNKISLGAVYNTCLFKEDSIRVLGERYAYILTQAIGDINKKLKDFTMITEEEKDKILFDFNNTKADYPHDKTIYQLFEEQVAKTPNNTAVVFRDRQLTYIELDKQANKLANYLITAQNIKPDTLVGMFIENSIEQIVAILGILKAGAAYVPISTGLPEERIKTIINDSEIRLMISTKKNIKMLNKLQWECSNLETFICMDTRDIYSEHEAEESGLMDKKLWEFIGENAVDEITGGGWASSYTGEALSKEEMDEYADNVFKKLEPYLNPKARVLEIGCASGISMFRIAPHVGMYYGTDLSGVIIEKDRERAQRENIRNINLECLAAHEIDRICEKDFDIVIINSVIQAFSGHNYLRQVIKKSVDLMGEKGILFIGDIMDQDKKYELLQSLQEFKRQNPVYETKTDLSEELFVSRGFFEDIPVEMKEIRKVDFSSKIHTIENELTRYRYDAVMQIDKSCEGISAQRRKNRYQYDLKVLDSFEDTCPVSMANPQNLAYIIYTSGTTGMPKGVMVEHKGVANLKALFDNVLGLNEQDKVIHFASISFDASVWDIFTGLLTGASLYIMPGEVIGSYGKFEEFLDKNKITFATLPPTYLVNLDPDRITSLRKLITAGSAASIELLEKWKDRVEYRNGYGPTESTVCATLWKHDREYRISNTVPIGKPANNIRVYIVDKNNNLQPVGVEGELCIAGVPVARGYLKRPELTAEKFIQSPFVPGERMYKSGDLARWLPDGNIEFLGRKDQQVKIRGFRIEAGEIEYQLLQHGAVKEAAVIARGDEDKYLCAYFTAHEELTTIELKDFLARRLPDYMIPLYFVQLDSMPLTSNSKVDIKALPDPEGRKNVGAAYVEPKNEIEEELVRIWKDILGVEKIGIDDDFFELGGHSLKATALVTNIHRSFNTEIQLKEVFEAHTIRGLAERIKSAGQSIYSSIRPAKIPQNCPDGYYPASSSQKRLYTINQYEGIGTGYNMPAAVVIEGKLDKEHMEETLRKLIERHESLRTSFETIEGEVMQRVHRKADLEIDYLDITDEGKMSRDYEKGSIDGIIKAFIRPFDLSAAPLMRAGLVKTAMDRYVLMLDMHHIISDGMSMNVLIKEFAYLYEGRTLPELRIQYKDFAVWQNELFKTEAMKKQEEYWQSTFIGDIPVLDMPCDYARPSMQSFEGDRLSFKIDRELTAGLNSLASKTGTTLYMVMLAAYNILLSKYTGQEDIVVGSPIAGRHHPDLENIIGFFVNTLALRNHPEDNKTFMEFLSELRKNTLTAFENQDYQFEQLVDSLAIPRDLSRNPLFDTMFVMQNLGSSEISIPDLKFTSLDIDYRTSKFDLKMEAMEWDDEIRMGIEYKTKLFDRQTIERLAQHYTNILRSIVNCPELTLSKISLMPDEEKKQVVCGFNQNTLTSKDQRTVKQIFEQQAASTPDSVALVSGDVRLTFRQLNNKANSLARIIKSKGIKPDDIIGILTQQSHHMIIGILGVLKAGAAYLPLDPEFPEDRIEYMLEDSGAPILLSHGELVHKAAFKGEVINLDCKESYDGDTSDLPDINSQADLVYLIYTSGTTGKPKGVMIENHSLVNYVNWFKNKFDIRSEDKTVIVSSLCFDLAYTALYSALLSGSEVHLIPKQAYSDPEILLPYMKRNGITYIKSTPSHFNMIVNSRAFSMPEVCKRLRLVVLGGEEISLNDVEIFNISYPESIVMNHYGPTETTIGAIAHTIDFGQFESYKKHPVIGRPIDNAGVYILDRNLNPVPVGVTGEIYINGEGVARGYLKRPELTAKRFVPNPFITKNADSLAHSSKLMYKTGDMGRYMPDGSIKFLGRTDNQIKIRGYRVDLGEIEAQLLRYGPVKEALVVVKEDQDRDKYIVAYMVCSEELTGKELKEYLSERIPHYMTPSYFVRIEKMPLTLNGKVDTKALPEPQRNKDRNHEEPGDYIEIKLFQIWSEILRTERIGINDSFFELGGHSLKATLLINRIHKELNVTVPLKEIFTLATIKNIAGYIKDSRTSIYSSIRPVKEDSHYAISSAQRRMFVLSKLEGTGVAYNLPGIIEVYGKLCRERFEEAFRELVRRHEALRTSFKLVDEELVQVVHEHADLRIGYTEADEGRIQEIIKGFVRPFDLARAPLFRVELVKIMDGGQQKEDRHIIMYDMHHIISDGVSRRIMVEEFISLYQGEHLKQLRLQYKDFAAWQNSLLGSEEIKKQEEYWKERFEGDIPVLNMPTDFSRPNIKSFAGSNISFTAGSELASELKKLALGTGTTLYMVLLSAYKVLLSRYSGQDDLVVGSPIAGRPHADLENIMGMFVNMIAIRSFPIGDKTFMEFLKEVREHCLKAYENQEYQYEELVEKLGVRRDMSRNPLFDVSFTLQNLDIEEIEIGDLRFKPYQFENKVSKFDLTLWCAEGNGNIEFILEYCTDMFRRETAERLARDYVKVLESIVKDADIRIKDIILESKYVKREKVLVKEIQFNL